MGVEEEALGKNCYSAGLMEGGVFLVVLILAVIVIGSEKTVQS